MECTIWTTTVQGFALYRLGWKMALLFIFYHKIQIRITLLWCVDLQLTWQEIPIERNDAGTRCRTRIGVSAYHESTYHTRRPQGGMQINPISLIPLLTPNQANILITSSHRACLADFGLSTSGESRILKHSSGSHTRITGTVRWQAPELLISESDDFESPNRNTCACDIYSFGCVCYEVSCFIASLARNTGPDLSQVFSGQVPLHEVSEWIVPVVVNQGRRPLRPSHDICLRRGLDNDMWNLMEACWQMEPSNRPTAGEVVARICTKPSLPTDTRPDSNWDNMFVSQLRSNLTHHPFCFPPDEVVVPSTGMNVRFWLA